MFKVSLLPGLGIAAGLSLLVLTAIQYPLSTSFPIGGDAAALIRNAVKLTSVGQAPGEALSQLFNSRYPLTDLILAAFSALPVDWPEAYIWCLVTAQVATGASTGWLLWRLNGWPAAAIGMAVWSLTTTTINNHFEDGTLAQLWSLPFLALFLERAYRLSVVGSVLALAATLLTHPLTGVVLLITLVASLLAGSTTMRTQTQQERVWFVTMAMFVLIILNVAVLLLLIRSLSLNVLRPESRVNSLPELIRSRFGPFVLLAPLGYVLLSQRSARPALAHLVVCVFFMVVALAAFNNLLGAALAPFRFLPYLLLSCTILSSYALPEQLRQVLPRPWLRGVFVIILFVVTGAATVHGSSQVYAYYETPSNYARLHIDEQAAFAWMGTQLRSGSVIGSSEANRHSEWIPILTPHDWEGLPAQHPVWQLKDEALANFLHQAPYTHLVFLKKREDVSEQVRLHPNWFTLVYENNAATIFAINRFSLAQP